MLKTVISLIASCNTIYAMRLAGRGDQRFNIVGLCNCVLWTTFTVITASWGLMVLNFALLYTYLGNIKRWRRQLIRKRDMSEHWTPETSDTTDDKIEVERTYPYPHGCQVCGTSTGEHGFSFSKKKLP